MSRHPSLRSRAALAVEVLEDRWVADASTNLLLTLAANAKPDFQPNAYARGVQLTRGFDLLPGVFEAKVQGVTVNQAINSLKSNGLVVQARQNVKVQIDRVPNDPSFSQQYALQNTGQSGGIADQDIAAPLAWDQSVGTGAKLVAVIDTGIDYNHPDLASNIWVNPGEIPGNNRDDDGNGFVDDVHGFDFVNNDGNPMDDNGHGTHVAGTIGAVTNNGVGVAGVNWNVKMMALKFLDRSGSGYLTDAIASLDYAVRMGAKISNNSWGGGGFDSLLNTAIANARANGHIFVAAAGNESNNNDTSPSYPASYNLDNIVSVAAVDNRGNLASFSNFGATSVDIAAPGVNILSTLPNNRYGNLSGTSMATPHVTGAISLVWDAHPTLTYREVINKVLSSGDTLSTLNGKVAGGRRLDVAAALGTPAQPPQDTTGPKIASVEFLTTGVSLVGARLTFSEAINPSTLTLADLSMTGPTGTALVLSSVSEVSGSGGKVFLVSLQNAATETGTYKLTISPDISDAAGNKLDSNGNGIGGELADAVAATYAIASQFSFTNSTPVAIRDWSTSISRIEIGQDITIGDLNVRLNINHTWVSDLVITLQSPNGTQVRLFNRRGGDGQNLTGTLFDDEATIAIRNGSAPFSGTFRPEASLTNFDNRNARGTWTLYVSDRSLFDTGTLVSWSLEVTPRASTSLRQSGSRVGNLATLLSSLTVRETTLIEVPLAFQSRLDAALRPLLVRMGQTTQAVTVLTTTPTNQGTRSSRVTSRLIDELFQSLGLA